MSDFISDEQLGDLQKRLAASERESKRLAREMRLLEKRNAILRLNYETQLSMTKSVAKEKLMQEIYMGIFMQSCPDVIIMLDDNLRFLLGTDSVMEIINVEDVQLLRGIELPAILKRYHSPIFTQEVVEEIQRASVDFKRGRTFVEVQFQDNTYEAHIFPFKKSDADFACVLVLMHNITEQVHARNLAEMASAAKGEFLSRMSHEMRTPMNAIIGMAEIAKNTDDSDQRTDCLSKIGSASKHLLGLINDVLDMSKIEADKLEIYAHPFVFKEMLDRVTSVVSFGIRKKHQNFAMDIDDSIPLGIVGDELRITQVITNLLSNANKFTPVRGSISLGVRRVAGGGQEKESLRIAVTDTGIGISQEHQSKLFSAFEQLDGGTARKFGGTGLGLAISKRIVEMMGGQIWIESKLDKGSTFVFTVPFEVAAENLAEAAAEPEEEKPPCLAGHTILVAEDIDINQEIIAAALKETEADVVFAENGEEAVAAFKAEPGKFGLILMDIQMPLMDGFEATRTIRALGCPEAASVPIIAMTANVFKEDVERCLAAGADGHLGKPLDWSALFRELALYLGP